MANILIILLLSIPGLLSTAWLMRKFDRLEAQDAWEARVRRAEALARLDPYGLPE